MSQYPVGVQDNSVGTSSLLGSASEDSNADTQSEESSSSESSDSEYDADSDSSDSSDSSEEAPDSRQLPRRLSATEQTTFLDLLKKQSAVAYKVRSDDSAESHSDVAVYAGEVVELLSDSFRTDKSLVRTADGQRGLVAKSNLLKLVDRTKSNDSQQTFKRELEASGKRICVCVGTYASSDVTVEPGDLLELVHAAGSTFRVRTAGGDQVSVPKTKLVELSCQSKNASPPSSIDSSSPKPVRRVVRNRRQNNYVDHGQVGSGTFGQVHLVTRRADGLQLVIKSVPFDRDNGARILKEASFLAKHPHAHIVRFYGSFAENGQLHIEMEYCRGGTLRKAINAKIAARMSFRESDIRKWIFQLSLALKHLHTLEIVHRDVKAENVYLTANGDACKLGDFGSASQLHGTFYGAQANSLIGTFPYLAPEIMHAQPYDTAVDVWSLGVLVYFLATLHYPFGENMVDVCKRLASQVRPMHLPHSRSRDLRRFVNHLLVFDAKKRPSMKDVLDERFLWRRFE